MAKWHAEEWISFRHGGSGRGRGRNFCLVELGEEAHVDCANSVFPGCTWILESGSWSFTMKGRGQTTSFTAICLLDAQLEDGCAYASQMRHAASERWSKDSGLRCSQRTWALARWTSPKATMKRKCAYRRFENNVELCEGLVACFCYLLFTCLPERFFSLSTVTLWGHFGNQVLVNMVIFETRSSNL